MREFRERHQRTREFFLHRFEQVREHLLTDQPLSENRRLLIGSYFTQEYALESAALFNPSMVWHPDQSGLPEGSRRFILSLRATGEGHISSITFRSGVIDAENRIRDRRADPVRHGPGPGAQRPVREAPVHRKLTELGINGSVDRPGDGRAGRPVHARRPGAHACGTSCGTTGARQREFEPIAQTMLVLAKANYEIRFEPGAGRLGADHLPVRRRPRPTASRTPGSSGSPTTTAASATTPPTPPTTAG